MKKYKIIIIGSRGVGKSTFVNRLSNEMFERRYLPTTGVEKTCIKYFLNGQKILLDFYEGISENFCETADCVLIMFSHKSKQSFDDISNIIQVVKKHNQDIPFIICGNKSEKKYKQKIPDADIWGVIKEDNTQYFHTSVKTGYNMDKIIDKIVELIEKKCNDTSIGDIL